MPSSEGLKQRFLTQLRSEGWKDVDTVEFREAFDRAWTLVVNPELDGMARERQEISRMSFGGDVPTHLGGRRSQFGR